MPTPILTIQPATGATVTLAAGDSIALGNSSRSKARLEVAGKVITANHSGTGVYGPFEAGTARIGALAGVLNYSVGSSPSVAAPNELNPSQVAAAVSLVGQRPPSLNQTMSVLGDSFAFQSHGGSGPAGLTFTRTNDVVVVTGATSHIMYPGALITVVGMLDPADEAQRVPVISYLSSSSFSYPSPGADGVMAQRASGSGAVMMLHSYQSAGFWAPFNRLTNGAYKLVSVAGFPGAATDVIATKVATHVAPYAPHRVVYFAGYNDLTAGRTVAQTVASVRDAVDAYPAALWDIFSTAPFNSGAANNTAANLRQLSRYYPALKAAFANYPNVRVHNTLSMWGLSTGLAKTGYISTADSIHPGPRAMYEAAKYTVTLDSKVQTAVELPVTTLDTRTADAASLCLLDNPLMGTSIASTLTNVTGNMPTGGSGALTGTSASGVSSLESRADGFGNNWVVTYTPANADNVLRMSFSGLQTRFVSGGTIDSLVFKVNISGVVAGKIKNMSMVMVWIADGVTYAGSCIESQGSSSTIDHTQQEDVAELTFCMRDVKVPVFASLTTARFDFTISHSAAGTEVVAKIAQAQITLAA